MLSVVISRRRERKKDEYSLPFSYISKQRTGSPARQNIWLLSFLYNQMLNDKIREYEATKKMLRNTPAMYKKTYPFLKEVDSLALANVQMHLEKAYKNFFQESKDWLSKIQIKTQEPKKLYDKCGQWKYSGRRSSDKTTEVEMDPYEKTS